MPSAGSIKIESDQLQRWYDIEGICLPLDRLKLKVDQLQRWYDIEGICLPLDQQINVERRYICLVSVRRN
jgi:hypothetical protein